MHIYIHSSLIIIQNNNITIENIKKETERERIKIYLYTCKLNKVCVFGLK